MLWRESIPFSDFDGVPPLPVAFYARPTDVVARCLIGKVLVFGDLAGRIVETEAYLGPEDAASHAAPGRTMRNAVMFGPVGVSYVYFIYGMYHCLNVVAREGSEAGAVLIRAVEPLCGINQMRTRRPASRRWQDLASGPGKLTRAFAIGAQQQGLSFVDGPLHILDYPSDASLQVAVSPRIGISRCADWPFRFFAAGHPCVSRSPLNRDARPVTNAPQSPASKRGVCDDN